MNPSRPRLGGIGVEMPRITSYNVCYTKLLRLFDIYRDEVRRFIRTRLSDLGGAGGDYAGRTYWVAGVMLGSRVQTTASGRMGIIQLADDSGRFEIVAFREVFEKHRHKLREDA